MDGEACTFAVHNILYNIACCFKKQPQKPSNDKNTTLGGHGMSHITLGALILAGGQNRRMGGSPKALLPNGSGALILDGLRAAFAGFDEKLLSTNTPELARLGPAGPRWPPPPALRRLHQTVPPGHSGGPRRRGTPRWAAVPVRRRAGHLPGGDIPARCRGVQREHPGGAKRIAPVLTP